MSQLNKNANTLLFPKHSL